MVSGFQLFVQQGPQAGQSFAVNKPIITIGREAGNDIVLESPQISRYHTRLTLQGGAYVVEDMGSTNGTFLNGQRVLRPTPVTSGDLIGVGEIILLKVQGVAGETVVERGQPQFVMPAPPPVYAPPPPVYAPPPPVYAPPPPVYAPPPYAYRPPPSNGASCWMWGCGCLLALALVLGCLGVIAALTPLGAVLLGLIPPGILTP
jgi:hypothetical protein